MRRSPSVSSRWVVPGCVTHGAKPQRIPSKDVTGRIPSCAMVTIGVGGAQSTVAFQTSRRSAGKFGGSHWSSSTSIIGAGALAGGRVGPSGSAGSMPPHRAGASANMSL
jgi:hypothetical protein